MTARARPAPPAPRPSVNALAAPLVERLVSDAARLRLGIDRVGGAMVIDAGIQHPGGIEAGRRIAEICLGGLGRVALVPAADGLPTAAAVAVHAADPVLACLGSQYAGWALKEGKFMAMASGPGRARALKEELFAELGYGDAEEAATFVLEVDRVPPEALVARVAEACRVAPDRLACVLTPTSSLAGCVQIVARSLEVALHKAHALKFPLERIRDGFGVAPMPPPAPDFVNAMGRTNDAILYGARVALFVDGPEHEAGKLADALPSTSSRDYGRPFAEIFQAYDRDFYKIDPLLFSPGLVEVTALETGRCFRRGHTDTALLARSFGVA